jgi:hypothetical protein
LLLQKISYKDETDPEAIKENLDKNNALEECILFFIKFLTSNPKLILDLKKYILRVCKINSTKLNT